MYEVGSRFGGVFLSGRLLFLAADGARRNGWRGVGFAHPGRMASDAVERPRHRVLAGTARVPVGGGGSHGGMASDAVCCQGTAFLPPRRESPLAEAVAPARALPAAGVALRPPQGTLAAAARGLAAGVSIPRGRFATSAGGSSAGCEGLGRRRAAAALAAGVLTPRIRRCSVAAFWSRSDYKKLGKSYPLSGHWSLGQARLAEVVLSLRRLPLMA